MGQIVSGLSQSFPPSPEYTVDQIPDLTGKVVMVTGGTAGIGKETVKILLTKNAKVYLAARDPRKAVDAIGDLTRETGREAVFLHLDLASLRSVKAAAEEFQNKESELHILFNNAGAMVPPIDQITVDGYDLQFGVNVLGHHYFTQLLLPILLATAKNTPDKHVRVLANSSIRHESAKLDFNTFKDGPARRKSDSYTLYDQSKFGIVVHALELARRYGDQGIVSVSLNPGNVLSALDRPMPLIQKFILGYILYPVELGAITQLWGGTSPEGAQFNGKYLIPWARLGRAIPATQDPETGKQLWKWLEEQVEQYESSQDN